MMMQSSQSSPAAIVCPVASLSASHFTLPFPYSYTPIPIPLSRFLSVSITRRFIFVISFKSCVRIEQRKIEREREGVG